jgi:hypothetical protein
MTPIGNDIRHFNWDLNTTTGKSVAGAMGVFRDLILDSLRKTCAPDFESCGHERGPSQAPLPQFVECLMVVLDERQSGVAFSALENQGRQLPAAHDSANLSKCEER